MMTRKAISHNRYKIMQFLLNQVKNNNKVEFLNKSWHKISFFFLAKEIKLLFALFLNHNYYFNLEVFLILKLK